MTLVPTRTAHMSPTRRKVILGALVAGGLVHPAVARQIIATKVPPAGADNSGWGSDTAAATATPTAATPTDQAPDPAVAALVAQVSQARLRGTVTALSGFATRATDHPDFPQVEDWMTAALRANVAPDANITRQAYALPSGQTRHNIIAGSPLDPRGVIVLGAHLDSTSEQPQTLAPGANDNASGIAVLLEAHRILSRQDLGKEVVFVAFSGEEQDLLGSAACARIARRDGWPIALMFNLDMLGFRPASPAAPIVVEYDQGNAVAGNDAAARDFGLLTARLAAAHSTLDTTHTDIWDSDYMFFEEAGYPCIGLCDNGADAPEYHTSRDTVDTLDFARLEQVARIVVASLATFAGPPTP